MSTWYLDPWPVGMRVTMSPKGLRQFLGRSAKTGAVVGNRKWPEGRVGIRRDGCKSRETWHVSFWEPEKVCVVNVPPAMMELLLSSPEEQTP